MHDKSSDTNTTASNLCESDLVTLAKKIKQWGRQLGFAEIGIARADASAATPRFLRWLELGRHGEMDYMAKHAELRARPDGLLTGTQSIISVRLPYWPQDHEEYPLTRSPNLACISRYALGRDYHKTVRNRLQKLADHIDREVNTFESTTPFAYRAFSDSAPILEVEFARQSGIAWRGKHTLSLTRQGSWHFLGELFTNLPLPPDVPIKDHCGSCNNCIDACPTKAIVAPYEVDARLCISYLTIELQGAIPEDLRPLIGNRIYGCDDCQTCCPWNRFARLGDADFAVRNGLQFASLTDLFAWSEEEFNNRLAGSPIRRIGHERWLRNIAVALGNTLGSASVANALHSRLNHPSALVREHVTWALAQIQSKTP